MNKVESAASTPGDKAVLDNLKNWCGALETYLLYMSVFKPNQEQPTEVRNRLKRRVDVCSADQEKTLTAAVAAEKSECALKYSSRTDFRFIHH